MELTEAQQAHPKRQYFVSFEAALTDFGLPLDNRVLAREVAARVPHDAIYIPRQSRQYIALSDGGGRRMAVAVDSGYAWIRADLAPLLEWIDEQGNGYCAVAFPVNGLRAGGYSRSRSRSREEVLPPVCDGCDVALPATGVCDTCVD